MWEMEEKKVTWWKEEGEHTDLITQWREGKQGTGETIQGGGQEQRQVWWNNLCRRGAPLIELCISSCFIVLPVTHRIKQPHSANRR